MSPRPSVNHAHEVPEELDHPIERVDSSPTKTSTQDKKHQEERCSAITPDGEEATEDEIQNLRHVADRIPFTVWLVAGVSLTERFTYYGINSPFQNYVQNSPDDLSRPGGLGLGQARATNLNDAFQFIVYLSPVAWAILADTSLGRYRTICIATGVYLVGVTVIFATSTPVALHHNASLGGFLCGMITAGLGLGGIKACVPPFMADQYTESKFRIKVIKKHERVVIDKNMTLQSIYSVRYWCVNLGALSGIATTWMERDIGFWAAFLLPTCFLCNAVTLLLLGRRKFARQDPSGSILASAFGVFSAASKAGFRMNAAKPREQLSRYGRQVPWTASFVEELKLGLVACRVFLAFSVAWLCHSQINTNLVSQAAQMQTHGIPNDTFQNLSALTVIIAMPLVQHLLYPLLRRLRISHPPIYRITVGFLLQGGAMAYAAGVQQLIYNTGPCYDMPNKCSVSQRNLGPNHINIAIQIPAYILDGLAGIFFYPTGQEYAYTKAPASMKSLVQSILMVTVGLGAALAFSLSPAYKDPTNVIMYASVGGFMFLTTCVFCWLLRKYNKIEEGLKHVHSEDNQQNSEELEERT